MRTRVQLFGTDPSLIREFTLPQTNWPKRLNAPRFDSAPLNKAGVDPRQHQWTNSSFVNTDVSKVCALTREAYFLTWQGMTVSFLCSTPLGMAERDIIVIVLGVTVVVVATIAFIFYRSEIIPHLSAFQIWVYSNPSTTHCLSLPPEAAWRLAFNLKAESSSTTTDHQNVVYEGLKKKYSRMDILSSWYKDFQYTTAKPETL